jgi:hypothetical protein
LEPPGETAPGVAIQVRFDPQAPLTQKIRPVGPAPTQHRPGRIANLIPPVFQRPRFEVVGKPDVGVFAETTIC